MLYNTETAAREIVKRLLDYKKKMMAFDQQGNDLKKYNLPAADYDKKALRLEVEREAYVDKAKEEIMSVLEQNIEQEEKLANAKRIAEERRAATIFSTAEHQVKISNALKLIELLGDKMTVDQLQSIVNPFITDMDYSTLRLLQAVAKNVAPNLFTLQGLCGKSVNFGEIPGDSLNFMREIAVLVPRVFSTDSAMAVAFIDNKVNQFFGHSNTQE